MRTSLQVRLTLNFLIIILVTLGILAVATNIIISDRFNEMVFNSGQRFANRVAPLFTSYYEENRSWDGIETYVEDRLYLYPEINKQPPEFPEAGSEEESDELNTNEGARRQSEGNNRLFGLFANPASGPIGPGPFEERILLIGLDGIVIYDSNPDGQTLPSLAGNLDKGVELIVDEEQVGTILIASSLGVLTSLQRTFLTQVNLFIFVIAVVSALVAVLIGWLQSRRIVAPVKALSGAAKKVADGDYTQRIEASRKDEIGEMANAFNTMAEDLEEQRVLRQRVMSDIAHELRTPLSVLQIDLESIQDGINQPNQENIGILRDQVIYIGKLVNDLRMLALADAGELSIEMDVLSLSSLIQAIASRVESSLKEKQLTLVLDLLEDDLLINGDEQRLSQVLLNLINNARQHTPPGGTIKVSGLRVGDEIQISIEDNGEGIPDADLPHVFDRLYRSSNSRSRKTGGTGLGLSIARSLVEAHHGRVWIRSKEGQGTTISFSLPAEAKTNSH